MERTELKLVRAGASGRLSGRLAPAVGLLLVALAALAGLLGAGEARRPPDVRELAEQALQGALARGNTDAQVRERLLQLRRHLARRPLDQRTRVTYASLLLSLCGSLDETRAPVFHAGLAARLSPVTVPVVRRAALVLARGGESERALELTRAMFGYDEGAAADLLLRLESLVFADRLADGLADTPGAWEAWSLALQRDGRPDQAHELRVRAHARWPDDLAVLERLAARAAHETDWDALAELLPPERELPLEQRWAGLTAYRARLAAERGEAGAARRDIDAALALNPRSGAVHLMAGESMEALGETEAARHAWNRALFSLPAAADSGRRAVLVRLARLEEREGQPSAALRQWRSLLALDPDHAEARLRIRELSGLAP